MDIVSSGGGSPAPIAWTDANLPKEYWWINVGRFNARLGVDAMAIGASTHDACKACVSLLGMSQYCDLKDPTLVSMLNLLIATNQPTANAMFPGSGPMTVTKRDALMSPPTTEYERYIKGLVQPV